MSEIIFDPKEIEPIPAGEYASIVQKAEFIVSKAGNKYLCVDFVIIQGSQQGKTISKNFHVSAVDTRYRQDSRRQLARLVKSCGVEGALMEKDLPTIYEKPLLIQIIETRDSYGETNAIVGFSKLKGSYGA